MATTVENTLTSITPRAWSPTSFEVYQNNDIMQFRAQFNSNPATDVVLMTFMANRDVSLYGELMMNGGAMRSLRTFSINVTTSGEDVVSFRSGNAPGDEVLRILSDGTITSGTDVMVLAHNILSLQAYTDSAANGAEVTVVAGTGSAGIGLSVGGDTIVAVNRTALVAQAGMFIRLDTVGSSMAASTDGDVGAMVVQLTGSPPVGKLWIKLDNTPTWGYVTLT